MESLLKIRQEMAREADYDVDLFAEMVRGGKFSPDHVEYKLAETVKITKDIKSVALKSDR